VAAVPIEKKGYRTWSGTTRGLAGRVLSLSLNDLRYKIKRPAVIVILAFLGIYFLIAGLIPILPSLFAGENFFIEDPTPHYSRTLVPEVQVLGAEIYDGNDTLVSQLDVNDGLFDLSLPPGMRVFYRLEVKNVGTGVGKVWVQLDPSPQSGRADQWTYDLSIMEQNGRSEGVGIAQDRERPTDHPPEWRGIDNDYSSLSVELSSGASREVLLLVDLSENASYDTLSLGVTVYAEYYDDFMMMEDGYWEEWTDYRTTVRFDIRPDIAPPVSSLRGSLVLELTGVTDPEGKWPEDRLKDLFTSPPEVKWNRELRFEFTLRNVGSETLHAILLGYDPSYLNIRGFYDEYERSLEDAEQPFSIGAGNTLVREVVVRPHEYDEPSLYYLGVVAVASEDDNYFDPDTLSYYYDGGMSPDDGNETRGKNQSYELVAFHVRSRQLPVDDETAKYFFGVFYMGGVNVWVIVFAIVVGSGLVADDRANKTLPLYYSKAIPRYGYALGKFIGFFTMMLLSTVVLSLVWYNVVMLLAGFSWDFYTSHLWVMGALTLYGLLVSAILSAMVLAGSTLSKNRYFVGAGVIALFLILTLVGTILWGIVRDDNMFLFSLSNDLYYVGEALFDLGTPAVNWWYSLLVLLGVFLASVFTIYMQLVRREEVVS